MNKIVLSYIVSTLWKIVRKHGMGMVLRALIEITDDLPEPYMNQLNKDLRKALSNYKQAKGT
jgi:hypothetical protein